MSNVISIEYARGKRKHLKNLKIAKTLLAHADSLEHVPNEADQMEAAIKSAEERLQSSERKAAKWISDRARELDW